MIQARQHQISAGVLLEAVRAPFLTATAVPVIVGAAAAWRHGSLPLGSLAVALFALALSQCGVNVLNDYFDHLSKNDDRYPKPGPFSGGTRLIQTDRLTAAQTLGIAIACFALMLVALVYLALTRGWGAWWLAVAGFALAIFYSAPPLHLSYVGRGLGELAVGLGFGPIMVLGTYYVETLRFDASALWASIPVGMLIAAVVLINEFPDYVADRDADKNTLVVALGPRRAVPVYAALVIGSFVVVMIGMAARVLPLACGIVFLTLPIAWQNLKGARRHYNDATKLIPSNAGTIKLHLTFGLLLACGYALSGILG